MLTVAVVPYDRLATAGVSAPEPSTSQALSAAEAMTGRPAGNPVAAAASGGQVAEAPGGRHELRKPRPVDRHREPLPVAVGRPRQGLVVEREIADLRRGRVDEPPDQPMDQEPGQPEVVADGRATSSGSLARSQFASQSAMKPATVSRRPRARNARPIVPPTNGNPSVRRWSSQTIAGRSGRPSASVTTIVLRWVVIVRPTMASRRDRRIGQDLPAGVAEGPPVELRVLLGPAGSRRDVRLDGDPGDGEDRPGGVEHERPDALRADVDGEDLCAGDAAHRRARS